MMKNFIKPIENSLFEGQNSVAENVIKQMVFEENSCQNRKRELKIIEKALPREGFRIVISPSRETS